MRASTLADVERILDPSGGKKKLENPKLKIIEAFEKSMRIDDSAVEDAVRATKDTVEGSHSEIIASYEAAI